MSKKIFWITFIATIISGIATIAFIPLAIQDVSSMVLEYDQSKLEDKSNVAIQHKGNMTKIQILGYYDKIILEKSQDNSMSVTKDQIASQLTGPYANMREELHSFKNEIYCIRYSNSIKNEAHMFTRENAIKLIASAFYDEQRVLTVYVPEGIEVYLNSEPYILENNDNIPIFIDRDSNYSSNNYIEYKPIDPELSSSEAPSPTNGSSSSSSPTGEVKRNIEEIKTELKSHMSKYNTVYTAFMSGSIDEDTVRTTLNDTLDDQLNLIKEVSDDTNNYLSVSENYQAARSYAELCIEENLIEMKSELIEREYEAGRMTKADYYAMDLELDQQEDSISTNMKDLAYATAGHNLKNWQNQYMIRIPFLYDVD